MRISEVSLLPRSSVTTTTGVFLSFGMGTAGHVIMVDQYRYGNWTSFTTLAVPVKPVALRSASQRSLETKGSHFRLSPSADHHNAKVPKMKLCDTPTVTDLDNKSRPSVLSAAFRFFNICRR